MIGNYQSGGAPQGLGQSRQKTTRRNAAVTAAGRLGAGVGRGVAKAAKPAAPVQTGTPPTAGPVAPAVNPYTLNGDPGLLMAEDQAQRTRAGADAQALYGVGALNASYGYDANGNIDTSNPYSRASLLVDTMKTNRRATQNNYASRGLLYSSARQGAQDYNGRQYGIQANQLGQQYQADKVGVGQDWLSAYGNAQDGIDRAAYDALLRKLNKGAG